jgi:hypothetical protein
VWPTNRALVQSIISPLMKNIAKYLSGGIGETEKGLTFAALSKEGITQKATEKKILKKNAAEFG